MSELLQDLNTAKNKRQTLKAAIVEHVRLAYRDSEGAEARVLQDLESGKFKRTLSRLNAHSSLFEGYGLLKGHPIFGKYERQEALKDIALAVHFIPQLKECEKAIKSLQRANEERDKEIQREKDKAAARAWREEAEERKYDGRSILSDKDRSDA